MIQLQGPPYKGTGGHYLTSQLFFERWSELKPTDQVYEPVFTLNGKEGYIDARTTFVSMEDPTGYKWAVKYLGSWKHFEKLLATSWFPVHFEDWVREVRVKLRSDAIAKIKQIAGSAAPTANAAAKYLANGDYDSKRGRPSAAEMKGELKRQAALLRQEDEDADRIGLKRETRNEIN